MDCDKLDCDYRNEDKTENCGLGTGSKFCPMFQTNSLTNKKDAVAKLHCSDGLSSLMDNTLAHRLGEVALLAGKPGRPDVGDFIDRGLILRRLLEENGFLLIEKRR